MKLLSLAIAAYNMEDYLERCLSSVTGKDVPDTLEVIVVNDGSTDHTSEIAHRFEKEYPAIIKVIDKGNAHYGSCINEALKIAQGRYFRPLDADDYLNHPSLITFLSKLEECTADLVITDFSRIFQYKKQDLTFSTSIKANTYYEAQLLNIKEHRIDSLLSVHNMTYKTQLLKDSRLQLLHGVSYTDTQYCMIPIDHTDTIIYFDINLYQYDNTREGRTMQKSILTHSAKDFYMVATALADYYITKATGNNVTIRSNQRCFLRRVLYYFFVATLIYGKTSEENTERLTNLYGLICKNEELKTDVLKFTFKRIPFVLLWQKYNTKLSDLLPEAILK